MTTEVDYILQSAWTTFGQPSAGVVVGGGGSGGSTPVPGTGSGLGGGAGWPTMNNVVQAYIDQANLEIDNILKTNKKSVDLNVAYNAAGLQLMREQRARYIGIAAVPSPTRAAKLNPYPITILSFVDAIQSLSQDTRPHMYGQTLEAISDMSLVGGQSQVAMTRESRNQSRLQLVGAELDNTLPGSIGTDYTKTLISNGTVGNVDNGINTSGDPTTITPTTTPGIPGGGGSGDGTPGGPGPGPGGNGTGNIPDTTGYTQPGILVNVTPNGPITPEPPGYYDPNKGTYNVTNCLTDLFEVSPIIEILSADATGDAVVKAGPKITCDIGTPLDFGNGLPGTLNGSQYVGLVPDNLRWPYIAGTLTPATYSVDEAINEVIKCNCDCWID